MTRFGTGILVLGTCVTIGAQAQAESYSLSCHGEGFGSASAPVAIEVDTSGKKMDVRGEAYSEVTIEAENVAAMKGTEMVQVNLSTLEGVALTDQGLVAFACKKN